jgi:hypothetical protein
MGGGPILLPLTSVGRPRRDPFGLVKPQVHMSTMDWQPTARRLQSLEAEPVTVEDMLGVPELSQYEALPDSCRETCSGVLAARRVQREIPCFDGNYPIELPRQTALGKHVIQRTLANAARTGANPASVMQSQNDNAPALRRP